MFTYYLADNNGVVYNKVGWFEETDPYGNAQWYYGNDDGSLKIGWLEEKWLPEALFGSDVASGTLWCL